MSDTVKMKVPVHGKSVAVEVDKDVLRELEKMNIDIVKEMKTGIEKSFPEAKRFTFTKVE